MKSLSILYIYCLTIKLFGTLLSQKSFLNFSIISLSLSLSLWDFSSQGKSLEFD